MTMLVFFGYCILIMINYKNSISLLPQPPSLSLTHTHKHTNTHTHTYISITTKVYINLFSEKMARQGKHLA